MKKICICTTVSTTMKIFVVDTAKYLHEQCGYDITLICSDDEEFAKSLPPYIKFIPITMARGIDYSTPKIIRKMTKIFKKNRFDMVQYSTPNASFCASIAAKRARIPVRLYCQWGIRYVALKGVPRFLLKSAEKIICRKSTVIRAQSPKNMEFAISEGLYKPEKAGVVGYGGTIGVDLGDYDINKKETWQKQVRRKYKIADDDFVFGFSGRVNIDKGCTELLSAYKNVCEKAPQSKLLIVGPIDYNCGIDKELVDWAKQSKQVVFSDKIPFSEMCKHYAAMDVLVHPTYREGFGMALQEAGAFGVAAITTKVPGASEVFEDGISTLLVSPRSVAELEEAMLKVYNDRLLTKGLGEKAYERTKERYARPIMLKNQLEDYIKIVGK